MGRAERQGPVHAEGVLLSGPVPTLPRRASPSLSRALVVPVLGWSGAIVAGCALSAAVVARPILACAFVAAFTLAILGELAPAALLGLGLASLAVESSHVLGPSLAGFDADAWHKALLILSIAPYALLRGFDARLLLPVGAYTVVAILTVLASTPISGLTTFQMASSYVSLTIGWFLLALRWGRDESTGLLLLLALLPLGSLAMGFPLALAGVGDLLSEEDLGIARLGGATIPSHLAMLGCVGITAALLFATLSRKRLGYALAVVNLLIVAATFTRAAIAAALIIVAPALMQYLGARGVAQQSTRGLRAYVTGTAAAVAAVLFVPGLIARTTQGYDVETIATSGRIEAWGEFLGLAGENPFFGRGLGAGPVADIDRDFFLAQHNEYVRALLEGGYVGLMLVVVCVGVTLHLAARLTSAPLRPYIWSLVLAFALFSFTDNTLSAIQFVIPFCAALGIATSARTVGVQGVSGS